MCAYLLLAHVVYINAWFFEVKEPFESTVGLQVGDIGTTDARSGHLAYLVCYENSITTRYLMRKSYDGDRVPRATRQSCPRLPSMSFKLSPNVPRPWSYKQIDGGACCSMSLLTFLINQDQSTCGDIVQDLVKGIRSKQQQHQPYEFEALEDDYLCSLHHYVLGGKSSDDQQENSGVIEMEVDVQETDDVRNHLIVIMPWNGFVWELDSLEEGDTCLGPVGGDWSHLAHQRLTQWDKTFEVTGVAVDVQAIVHS